MTTEPFVAYINALEKTDFVFMRCLDKYYRNKCQPEILYVARRTGQSLVIEVKNLVWPPDHAKRHQSDHLVVDIISDRIRGLLDDAPYALTLPHLVTGKPAEIRLFAESIGASIIQYLEMVKSGTTIGSKRKGREWKFRKQEAYERDYDEPDKGLYVEWPLPDPLDFDRLQSALKGLSSQLQRHYAACTAKFVDYQAARRILLVILSGDIHLGDDDWAALMHSAPPPATVPEIWLVEDTYDPEVSGALQFTRLHGPTVV